MIPDLLWLFITPFICAILIALLPGLNAKNLKRLVLIFSFIPLILLLAKNTSWINSSIDYPWIAKLNIHFHLSIDSISLLFLFLTSIIIPISLLASSSQTLQFPKVFYSLVLVLQGLLIGFFTAHDLVLFTIFWEAMLLPLYFIINIWGGSLRQYASLKFLIYMIAGSALMIAAVLALYFSNANTFNLNELVNTAASTPYAKWICAIFLLAFAVKTPLFPFHGWLPDTYYQASTSGTILLSAILSKAGIYGILRISLPLFPTLMQEWSPLLLGLAITGVFYGGFAAWMEKDYKRLISFSSFSHVNFVLVGLFIWNETAHAGAILQALNHGITIAALFLVADWLQNRIGTTTIGTIGGVAQFMPHLCWLTLFFVLSSVALPGTNNFVGELLIFFGLFGIHPWLTAFLGLSVILSVLYMLRWMQKVYFETPGFFQDSWIDIKTREFAIAIPLVAIILWIGIYPAPLLKQLLPAEKIVAVATVQK